jgi:hypothetical protein
MRNQSKSGAAGATTPAGEVKQPRVYKRRIDCAPARAGDGASEQPAPALPVEPPEGRTVASPRRPRE